MNFTRETWYWLDFHSLAGEEYCSCSSHTLLWMRLSKESDSEAGLCIDSQTGLFVTQSIYLNLEGALMSVLIQWLEDFSTTPLWTAPITAPARMTVALSASDTHGTLVQRLFKQASHFFCEPWLREDSFHRMMTRVPCCPDWAPTALNPGWSSGGCSVTSKELMRIKPWILSRTAPALPGETPGDEWTIRGTTSATRRAWVISPAWVKHLRTEHSPPRPAVHRVRHLFTPPDPVACITGDER